MRQGHASLIVQQCTVLTCAELVACDAGGG
jgi:hypothetical protein